MPAIATRTPRTAGSDSGQGNNNQITETHRYKIIDAKTRAEAAAAIGLPVRNQELTPGSPLRVASIGLNQVSPIFWEADVNYAIPPNGGFTSPEADPLLRPKRLTWGVGYREIAMEIDADGVQVFNSAGERFDPPIMNDTIVDTLQVRWFLPTYDRQHWNAYRNKCNSDPVIVGGTSILPGEMLCRSIMPAGEYEIDAPYIEMLASFELDFDDRPKPTPNATSVAGDPFDAHVVDRSLRGWYVDPDDGGKLKMGWFCIRNTTTGMFVGFPTEPILLRGDGLPLPNANGDNASIGVANSNQGEPKVLDPEPSPTRYWMSQADRNVKSPFSSDKATVFRWRKKKRTPFASIFA